MKALVTGGSRGIGEAISLALAAAGADVAVAARKPEALEAVAAKITATGRQALAIPCHAGKPADIDALFDKLDAEWGGVDVLINNAATNPHFGPLIDITDAALDKILEVNLKGYLSFAKGFVARHRARGAKSGSIVNIASVAGMMAAPFQGAYGMTKAAVLSMTRTLAVELAGSGIRVNAIAPGLIETKFSSAIVSNDAMREQVVSRTALRRHGQPHEIADAAVFLATDASSYVTGSTIVIDGGLTIT